MNYSKKLLCRRQRGMQYMIDVEPYQTSTEDLKEIVREKFFLTGDIRLILKYTSPKDELCEPHKVIVLQPGGILPNFMECESLLHIVALSNISIPKRAPNVQPPLPGHSADEESDLGSDENPAKTIKYISKI